MYKAAFSIGAVFAVFTILLMPGVMSSSTHIAKAKIDANGGNQDGVPSDFKLTCTSTSVGGNTSGSGSINFTNNGGVSCSSHSPLSTK